MAKKLCAAYLRVSTHDQEEYSPDSQLKLIREYAEKEKMLLLEENIFRDDGISGRSAEKRPGFQRMITCARQKPRPFDCILVWKFSRFARNQEESVVYKSLLKKENGVEVISISEPLTEGPFGGLIERIIEWFDAFYSANLAVEVRRGMEERVERGQAVNGAPLGYVYQNGKLTVVPEEAETVLFMFQELLRNRPVTEIARTLNSMGIRTKRGSLWENRTVRYVLENPVYVGKLRWRENREEGGGYKLLQGEHEPLLTPAQFAAARKCLKIKADRKIKNARQTGTGRAALLKGLVKCGACGSALVRTGKGLNCSRYAHGACPVSHYISTEKLELLVLTALRGQFLSIPFQRPSVLQLSPNTERFLRERLAKEQEALRRFQEAYAAGVDSLEEYQANKAAALSRIRELNETSERAETSQKPEDETKTGDEIFLAICSQKISSEEKKQLLAVLVSHIVYHKDSRTLEIFLNQ